jgi:hypothetical protein
VARRVTTPTSRGQGLHQRKGGRAANDAHRDAPRAASSGEEGGGGGRPSTPTTIAPVGVDEEEAAHAKNQGAERNVARPAGRRRRRPPQLST